MAAPVAVPRAMWGASTRGYLRDGTFVVLTLGGLMLVVSALTLLFPSQFKLLLLAAAIGSVAAVLGLRDPVLASVFLLGTTFFRLAVPSGTFPIDPFLLAYAGVVASVWIWARNKSWRLDGVGLVGLMMALFVVWTIISMIVPHEFGPGSPLNPEPFSLVRFILIGTVMPFSMFLVGRRIFATESSIRVLLWSLLAAAAYSAFVSIMQFHGPESLVWPRYIVDAPIWEGRAVGVFNQPVVNGLVLVIGFLVAILLASQRKLALPARALAGMTAVVTVYAIYLTHTRAAWLSFAGVLLIGTACAKGFRKGFAITGAVIVLVVAFNWASFMSSDRTAGGVGSRSEVDDRLNTLATSIWAFGHHPITGWGIGRFPAVNTYHHQQWSPEVPWKRGYGIVSHLDSVGILVELGLIGFLLWVAILVLVLVAVVRAVRSLPEQGLYNRPFALTALMSLIAWLITGTTVDLRFFDFPNLVVMTLAGSAIARAYLVGRRSRGPHDAPGARAHASRHGEVVR